MRHRMWRCLAIAVLGSVGASAGMITVNGMDDIFYAGQGTVGTNVGTGLGNFPGSVELTQTAFGTPLYIVFNGIPGSVNWCGGDPSMAGTCTTGAAGAADIYGKGGTNFAAVNGLSGIQDTGQIFFLVGVFTSGGTPNGVGPLTMGCSMGNVCPALDQLFVLGAGQDTVFIPGGATNLYFGFADGTPGFTGTIGAYGDNSGALTANYTIGVLDPCAASNSCTPGGAPVVPGPGTMTGGNGQVYALAYNRFSLSGESGTFFDLIPVPEPATFALMGLGLLGLAGWRRRAPR